jgi:hypothetical protein
MERKDEQQRRKSNASTAQKQDVAAQKRIADRVAGKQPTAGSEPAPKNRAAALEQEAYRPGAPTYDEQQMAERSGYKSNGKKQPSDDTKRDGSWYGTSEPELTDERTGATREPSALEEGIEALATEEGAGERTRYASDKAADKLEKRRSKKATS